MSELLEILRVYEAEGSGRPAPVLLQVVEVAGSHYRRAGARMLVGSSGEAAGLLSGGCLEQALAEEVERTREAGRPRLVRYDLTAPAEILWGFGLGCRGMIEVLFEPLASPERRGVLGALLREHRSRGWVGVATVLGSPWDHEVGARLVLVQGEVVGSTGLPETLEKVLEEALLGLDRSSGGALRSDERSGRRVLLEWLPPPLRLLACGAGPDVPPLLHLAESLGWQSSVGVRDVEKARRRFGDEVEVRAAEELLAEVDEHTAVVAMSHDYLQDLGTLRSALESPALLVSALGPRERTERLLAETELAAVSTERKKALRFPAGLDLGARTPREIALAIVGEILAVSTGHPAGFLTKRPGPIHRRGAAPPRPNDTMEPERMGGRR